MKYTYKNKYFLHIYYKHKETKENGRLIEQVTYQHFKKYEYAVRSRLDVINFRDLYKIRKDKCKQK